MKPKFDHDCDRCIFLGGFNEHDLYFCPRCDEGSVIARFSSNGPDYGSAPGFVAETWPAPREDEDTVSPLWVAYQIVVAKGLYKPSAKLKQARVSDFNVLTVNGIRVIEHVIAELHLLEGSAERTKLLARKLEGVLFSDTWEFTAIEREAGKKIMRQKVVDAINVILDADEDLTMDVPTHKRRLSWCGCYEGDMDGSYSEKRAQVERDLLGLFDGLMENT